MKELKDGLRNKRDIKIAKDEINTQKI